MEQIITMQADLDKKLDRQVVQKAGQSYHDFLIFRFLTWTTSGSSWRQ